MLRSSFSFSLRRTFYSITPQVLINGTEIKTHCINRLRVEEARNNAFTKYFRDLLPTQISTTEASQDTLEVAPTDYFYSSHCNLTSLSQDKYLTSAAHNLDLHRYIHFGMRDQNHASRRDQRDFIIFMSPLLFHFDCVKNIRAKYLLRVLHRIN